MPEQETWPLSVEDAAVASYLGRKRTALQQALNEAEAEWRTYLQNVAVKMGITAKAQYDQILNAFVALASAPQNGHEDTPVPALQGQ